jgi:4-hydroxybenzoyl-CoA thioesterase
MGSHSFHAGVPAAAATVHRFERPLRIRFSHCDPAGIVFFPQYMVMFNGLLEDWFTDGMGIPYGALIAQRRIGTPTVSLQCDFTAISTMGDDVTLGLTVLHIGGASFRLSIGCRQGAQERVRMTQVLVTTDVRTHRPIALPEDIRAAMARFQAE